MTAIIVLGPSGLATATRLKAALPGARLHGLAGRFDDDAGIEQNFTETLAHIRALFEAGEAVVGICAAGILIRAVAPSLKEKSIEPPLVAVADDGSVAVPLLGGHRGANDLARRIAAALNGSAAVTTAGDLRLGLSLDEPPPGWRIANPDGIKPVAAALLAKAPIGLSVEVGDAAWLAPLQAYITAGARPAIRVTDRAPADIGGDLIYHPPVLAVGLGCERGTDPGEVIALMNQTLADAGLASAAVAGIYSLDLKADEPAIHKAAEQLGVAARFFSARQLEAETPRLKNPSDIVFGEVGCHGVVEAAALAAGGPASALIVAKTKSKRATCAIARAPAAIAPGAGQPRGQLAIVGFGPGAAAWRTAEASSVLCAAEDVVGYGLYLDLIADLTAGARLHPSPLTEEEIRVRHALDLAAQGRRVALVGSGDAGIYALATLVFEVLDREDRGDWNRIAISVVPGVSALQAAAARIGAPLGHDFCAISLSDLLTPWADIERRLTAAAAGDFVVALYNPASKRRQDQLILARDILLSGRPAETPVILARNLGRAGEAVTVIALKDLAPERVDMLTLVLIGSSNTRALARGSSHWVYTPRGYERKGR
jgi:cobalt-precorrin 5A hydrolase/precorrin-3B C17-methyltransferase